jgi:hypothetical protein
MQLGQLFAVQYEYMHRPHFMKTSRTRWPSRRVRRLLLFLVVGGGILLTARHLGAPVHGAEVAVDVKATKPHLTDVKQAPAATLDQPYFTLNLPPGFTPQAATTTPSGQLFSQTIIKQASLGSLIIAIGIRTLPEGGIDEDSSYQLRTKDTQRYTITSKSYDGQQVRIANDKQSAVVVAFWQRANLLATISVSAGIDNPADGDNADSVRVLSTVLDAWKWK